MYEYIVFTRCQYLDNCISNDNYWDFQIGATVGLSRILSNTMSNSEQKWCTNPHGIRTEFSMNNDLNFVTICMYDIVSELLKVYFPLSGFTETEPSTLQMSAYCALDSLSMATIT